MPPASDLLTPLSEIILLSERDVKPS
ncbi:hypothetical protein SIM97_12805 [Pectobacterium zantedeschiae]|uniref:Uncharacterized protein n=1 Tax=Pectobacterium zantedeschiae TaxID=2034769 RepID=A0A9X8P745_9GAMM|nr:hypothetical protein [Pectobacterium zantedeschiae]RYC39805.1 hypothetical protein DEH81_16980 [Pectobacterium zantedeschiae]RYC46197.1 hypothetical protein CLR69_05515 [Pectobacterium zantedeschiae]